MPGAEVGLGVASAILGPIGALIGKLMSQGDREAAQRLREQAMAEYNIELPPVEDIVAQQVQTDPRDAQVQRDVYDTLLEKGTSGKLGPADAARLNEVQNNLAREERGQRGAILQGMRSRGMGGSGLELAAELDNQQNSADQASRQGIQIAGQADERAQAALRDAAGVASGVRAGDLAEGEYNAGARERTNIFNVGQKNNQFTQRVALADRRAGAENTAAAGYDASANGTAAAAAGVGQSLGQGAAAIGQNMQYQDWLNLQKQRLNRQTGPTANGYGWG